jgi:hypothetical protein
VETVIPIGCNAVQTIRLNSNHNNMQYLININTKRRSVFAA